MTASSRSHADIRATLRQAWTGKPTQERAEAALDALLADLQRLEAVAEAAEQYLAPLPDYRVNDVLSEVKLRGDVLREALAALREEQP